MHTLGMFSDAGQARQVAWQEFGFIYKIIRATTLLKQLSPNR